MSTTTSNTEIVSRENSVENKKFSVSEMYFMISLLYVITFEIKIHF